MIGVSSRYDGTGGFDLAGAGDVCWEFSGLVDLWVYRDGEDAGLTLKFEPLARWLGRNPTILPGTTITFYGYGPDDEGMALHFRQIGATVENPHYYMDGPLTPPCVLSWLKESVEPNLEGSGFTFRAIGMVGVRLLTHRAKK